MKRTYSIIIIVLLFGIISCKKNVSPNNETQNVVNNIVDNIDNNNENKTLEIAGDPYSVYKYEYDDDKYIVFNDGLCIKYVFNKKQSLNYVDYENDKPLFVMEKADLVFFKHIINDVLIYTYGSWADPVLVEFFDLLDGNLLLTENDGYFYKTIFFNNDYILLKEVGHRDKLVDVKMMYIDQDIYQKALELETIRGESEKRPGRHEDRLMFYQGYSCDFENKKIEPINKIIAYSFE